jgi:transposase
LVDGLQEADYPVHLANPAEMEKYSGLKQTDDETDALWIAEMLRLGILPTGYIYPKAERPVRDMLRRRMLIVRQATQMLLSLQSMVTRHTGQSVSAAKLQGWTLQELRDTFADPYSQPRHPMSGLELLGQQRRIQHSLEKQVLAVAKPTGPFQRLLSLPGVGNILGLTIQLETGPIGRFASAGDYASYCRAVNSPDIRCRGNKYLAWAYVEAANFAQRHNPRAQAWFASKTARAGRVVAVKALACRLAKAAYYVLRDDVDFDENKLFG